MAICSGHPEQPMVLGGHESAHRRPLAPGTIMRIYLADLGHNQLTRSSDVYPLGIANLATYTLAFLKAAERPAFRIFREPGDLVTPDACTFLEAVFADDLASRDGSASRAELDAVTEYLRTVLLHAPFRPALAETRKWVSPFDVETWFRDSASRPLASYRFESPRVSMRAWSSSARSCSNRASTRSANTRRGWASSRARCSLATFAARSCRLPRPRVRRSERAAPNAAHPATQREPLATAT
ncbi:MAG: hypothetical protein ABIP94_22785 [Planctomycetota bacterium]